MDKIIFSNQNMNKKRVRFYALKNEGGSVLMNLVMVMVGLSLFMSQTYFYSSQMQTLKTLNTRMKIQELKYNIKATLLHEESWQKIIDDNTEMQCLSNGSDCSSLTGEKHPINIIKDVSGKVVWGEVDSKGNTICSDSSENNPNHSQCSATYKVYWEPLCAAGCTNPRVKIIAELTPVSKKLPLNPSHYEFSIVK